MNSSVGTEHSNFSQTVRVSKNPKYTEQTSFFDIHIPSTHQVGSGVDFEFLSALETQCRLRLCRGKEAFRLTNHYQPLVVPQPSSLFAYFDWSRFSAC